MLPGTANCRTAGVKEFLDDVCNSAYIVLEFGLPKDQLYEICYEPYYKGCYKIPYWKKLGQHMKKNYPGLVQQP